MKEFFIDDSGKLSMGRLLCFLVVLASLFGSIWDLTHGKTFSDFNLTWAGFAAAMYGMNKFSPTYSFKEVK